MKYSLLFTLVCWFAAAQIPKLNDPFTTDQRISLYEKWIASAPDNTSNQTLLAAAYIQKTRETTDFGYLDRARKIVDKILANKKDYEAMRLRNLIELNWHHFSKVVEYAREMTQGAPLDPQNWGSLGDALMEMGQYDEALKAYQRMLSIRANLFSYNRMAYYRFVMGDPDGAIALMSDAIKAGAVYPENMAWCLVELGNMYFKTGHWNQAEEALTKAIRTFPDSHAAYAALAAVQAAQGQMQPAIENYKHAQSITPMPQYAGVLHDLYQLTGNKAEAQAQMDMLDLVAKLEEAAKQNANRTLALIYANQDRNLARSLELARADFLVRQDVYTYDALAWALYKNKQYEEARKASHEALKMGTPEALFYYHAGMIDRGLGDETAAKQHLDRALQLNSGFDIRQAAVARATLAEIAGGASKSAISANR